MSEPTSSTAAPAPAPSRGAFAWEVLTPFLCIAGLCLSAYLTVMHLGLLAGDVSLGGACGSEGDCNSVVSSRYGTLFGLPVSVWGMGYYIVALVLSCAAALLRREDSPAFVRATLRFTVAALAFDAYLAWAMAARVQRLCPLCVATYGINVLILLTLLPLARAQRGRPAGVGTLLPSLAGLVRPADPAYYREVLKLFLLGLGVAGCALVLVLTLSYSRAVYQSQREQLVGLLEYLRSATPYSIPTDGLPARGPAGAPTSIVVFSDFMCEKCRLASKYLDIVAANHRETLRITYVNYPADKACNPHADLSLHPGACVLARAASCADRMGRFWAFHDAVFDDPAKVRPENVAKYALRAGLDTAAVRACIAEGDSAAGLPAQIALARSVAATATPTIFIEGRPIVGALRPWMLEFALKALTAFRHARPGPGEGP